MRSLDFPNNIPADGAGDPPSAMDLQTVTLLEHYQRNDPEALKLGLVRT